MKPRVAALSVILALVLLAAPVPSHGQQSAKVYRIGWLGFDQAPRNTTPQNCPTAGTPNWPAWPNWQGWIEGLQKHGYIPGQNLVIECRWTEGRPERAPALAAELVSLKVDLIVANGTASVQATKQASSTIPIVMVGVIDPVGRGLVASLARPGGNVTGLTDSAGPEIAGKYLQLLKEAVPRVSRVAVLRRRPDPLEPPSAYVGEAQAAARALNLTLQPYEVQDPEEFAGAFAAMTRARAEALLVLPHPFWAVHATRIIDLAAQSRLPVMYPFRVIVEAGGLMSYEANRPDVRRRLGSYVDKILKGAKPGDLPVELPTKFELVINLKTAKALGLTIPPAILMRADEVIQ